MCSRKSPSRGVGGGDPPAAAVLGAVGAGREPLDVAVVGDGHHHVLLADQGFLVVVAQLLVGDHRSGAGRRTSAFSSRRSARIRSRISCSSAEDRARSRRCRPCRPGVLGAELVGLQAGELLEPHGEDRVGLHPGQAGRRPWPRGRSGPGGGSRPRPPAPSAGRGPRPGWPTSGSPG